MDTQPTVETQRPASQDQPAGNTTPALIGALLVVVGVLFLVAQFTNFDLGQYGWPLFVIVPGVALIALGLVNRTSAGLVIPGSMVTMTGLILAVQNSLGLWASWSYAWALIFPTSVGIGTALLGLVRNDAKQVSAGLQTTMVGLALFAVFGIFFEGVLHVDGINFGTIGNVVLPALLIVAGLVLLAFRLIPQSSDSSKTN